MYNSEIWKDIPNAIGYQVSNLGRIRSFRSRNGRGGLKTIPHIMKLNVGSKGYLQTNFIVAGAAKNVYPHKLVADLFVEKPESMQVVNHIDGNKFNNSASNLEWVTIQMNAAHAIKNGLYTAPKGEKCGASKLTNKQAIEILAAKGKEKQKDLAKRYGVGVKQIGKIHQRVAWAHLGAK